MRDQLVGAFYHSSEEISATFLVPGKWAEAFTKRLKMALGSLDVNTTVGTTDGAGNVSIGARLTGKAAQQFLEKVPGDLIDH